MAARYIPPLASPYSSDIKKLMTQNSSKDFVLKSIIITCFHFFSFEVSIIDFNGFYLSPLALSGQVQVHRSLFFLRCDEAYHEDPSIVPPQLLNIKEQFTLISIPIFFELLGKEEPLFGAAIDPRGHSATIHRSPLR